MKTQQKRRGRPPKSSGETKSEGILLRLDAQEKQGFRSAAELAGIPVAVWMRERLRTVARKELVEAGMAIPFLGNAKEGNNGHED